LRQQKFLNKALKPVSDILYLNCIKIKTVPIRKKSKEFEETTTEEIKSLFPLVAIGASAGGLQALNELLMNLPEKLGMAYVIIQHLSPNYESILPELLATKTSMPVHLVEDGMHIEKDNIYVIPPNTFMSIADSRLILSERVKTNSSYHSIDFFFKRAGAYIPNQSHRYYSFRHRYGWYAGDSIYKRLWRNHFCAG
jgi:two-component system CheB/CheR fusion protein